METVHSADTETCGGIRLTRADYEDAYKRDLIPELQSVWLYGYEIVTRCTHE